MSHPSRYPLTIGVNAQKMLSASESYHAAGATRYTFNLLRELHALNAPERFVAYCNEAHVPSELPSTPRFRTRGTRWPTQRPMARIAWEQLALPRLLHHDHVTVLHGAVDALPLLWRGRSVVTIFDLTFLRLPSAFKRGNRTYLKWAVSFAAHAADKVIAISEATRQDVIGLLRVDPQRVRRVYCGVDPRFRPLPGSAEVADLRRKWGLHSGFILYLGTIEPRKNIPRLVDAYAELRRRGATDLPLVLAGGRGWGQSNLQEQAEQAGVADDVRLVGFVPDREIPLWYNAADLFVYLSEYEGFGLPPLEALACGTPVVTSNRSSLPEVVGEAAVLVDPTDARAIADAMQQVLDDTALRTRLAHAGPDQASHFTWRAMAEQTLDVYRAVSAA